MKADFLCYTTIGELHLEMYATKIVFFQNSSSEMWACFRIWRTWYLPTKPPEPSYYIIYLLNPG
jgi:hypothetical protein